MWVQKKELSRPPHHLPPLVSVLNDAFAQAGGKPLRGPLPLLCLAAACHA